MLHRNCNDVIDDLGPQLQGHTIMRTALGRWGWGPIGKITDLQQIPASHMKPLMEAVIGHLEGKGLPKLEVAKTKESDVKKLIPNWENATKNSLAESKTQREGLSGFSSLSKKVLMALFKASLGPKPNQSAEGLIKNYATIEKNKVNANKANNNGTSTRVRHVPATNRDSETVTRTTKTVPSRHSGCNTVTEAGYAAWAIGVAATCKTAGGVYTVGRNVTTTIYSLAADLTNEKILPLIVPNTKPVVWRY